MAARAEIQRLQALKAFAREIIQTMAFAGHEGGDVVQELALKHGLLREEIYSRDKHGAEFEHYDGDEGDPICIMTDLLEKP
jgi:hypothetical protein